MCIQSCFGASAIVFLLIVANHAEASGRYYSVSYQPTAKKGELEIGVTHTIWIPKDVKQIRAIIVHQHGCGVGACRGGETAAYDLHWQALARKWDCALLGPSYKQKKNQNCRLWCDPRNGSSKVFLDSIQALAKKSGHPELATAPWCLWGHSGGAFWSSLMQTMYPERIVAIWFRSGTAFAAWEKGEIAKPKIPTAAYAIPAMCNPGLKEKGHKRFRGAWDGSMAMFKAYRAKGAPIGFAPDPRTGHECGDSRYLAIPFFDACLASRLPKKNGQTLKRVQEKQAWIAPLLGKTASPASTFRGDAKRAIWLPNKAVANAWSHYVKTGFVPDETPPPAPFAVTVKRLKSGMLITWRAVADFESGLRGFVIKRDGRNFAHVPQKPVGRFGKALFQRMSYHDTPEQPLPNMQYLDATAQAGTKHTYQVIAINAANLRSKSATAVSPK